MWLRHMRDIVVGLLVLSVQLGRVHEDLWIGLIVLFLVGLLDL
jgi:hypothetical protein